MGKPQYHRLEVEDSKEVEDQLFWSENGSCSLPVSNFLDRLNKIIKECEDEGWTDIHIGFVRWYSGSDIVIKGKRLETDSEFNARIDKLEKKRIKKEEKELKLLAELKEKYGDAV